MKPIHFLAVVIALAAFTGAARADDAKTYTNECAACHMAYPAQLMPARSWRAITAHLAQHFGEDASLDPATLAIITRYLDANAADARGGNRGAMRGLRGSDTPERITDMPFWRRIHRDLLRPGIGTGPGIRSAADCQRCHNGNGEGD